MIPPLVRGSIKPGFRFRDGKLMVFTEEEVNVVHAWPELESVRKLAGKNSWKTFVPRFRLLRPRADDSGEGSPVESLGPEGMRARGLDPVWEKYRAFALFRQSIPDGVARAVERFTNRQWALLGMCRHRELASELAEQSPALGFALAHFAKFRHAVEDGARVAARHSKLKQREIAGWLGFPESQAWVKILARIPPEVVNLDRLLSLRRASREPAVEKLLGYQRVLNAGVMALVSAEELACCITPALLAEVGESAGEAQTPQVIHLLREIGMLCRQVGREEPFRGLRSVEQVRRRHQELLEECEAHRERRERDRLARAKAQQVPEILPEPPLPGTEQIVPLKRVSELREEGRLQHNCVGSYGSRVHRGGRYIYRVLKPERATLSIVMGADGCWQIEQLYLSCNRPVSMETRLAVERWLKQYSLSM